MKQNRSLPPEAALFLPLEGCIYLTFLTLDLLGRGGEAVWLKYTGVLLCLIFSLCRRSAPAIAALGFSVCADWFLLVRGDHFLVGVLLFVCVQLCHQFFLHNIGIGSALPLRLGLAGVLLILLVLSGLADPITAAAAVYLSLLLSNLMLSLRPPAPGKLAVGLTLMLCCDICVGILYLPALFPSLLPTAQVCMWLFYLPGQVLISLL